VPRPTTRTKSRERTVCESTRPGIRNWPFLSRTTARSSTVEPRAASTSATLSAATEDSTHSMLLAIAGFALGQRPSRSPTA